jgi:hypothetical protein
MTIFGTAPTTNAPNAYVDRLRAGPVAQLSAGILGSRFVPTDAQLWTYLMEAEADASRRLRTLFAPTTVFAYSPTDAEIAALPIGRPYIEESPYDYEPHMWNVEDWGFTVVRRTPIISVEKVYFQYPTPVAGIFTVPLDWLRTDKKAGQIQFLPSASGMQVAPLQGFMLSMLSGGRNIPQMMRIQYTAGLKDAITDYPDLVGLIMKMAALRMIQDSFLPQSGSISADGLSQSQSVDVEKYGNYIDAAVDSLLQSIHGIRLGVL